MYQGHNKDVSIFHTKMQLYRTVISLAFVLISEQIFNIFGINGACIRGIRDRFVADSWSSHEFTNPRMS